MSPGRWRGDCLAPAPKHHLHHPLERLPRVPPPPPPHYFLWVLQHLRRPLSLSGPSKVTTTHCPFHFSPSPPTLSTAFTLTWVQWLCASSYNPRPGQLRVFSRRGWARENDARVDWPGESNHNKDSMLDFRLRSRTRLWRHTQTLSHIPLSINILTLRSLNKLIHACLILLLGHMKSPKLRPCKIVMLKNFYERTYIIPMLL